MLTAEPAKPYKGRKDRPSEDNCFFQKTPLSHHSNNPLYFWVTHHHGIPLHSKVSKAP